MVQAQTSRRHDVGTLKDIAVKVKTGKFQESKNLHQLWRNSIKRPARPLAEGWKE